MLDNFGKAVRNIRLSRCMLLYDMAKDLDISPTTREIWCQRSIYPDTSQIYEGAR